MKLWDKGYSTEKLIEDFTVGNDRELDLHIAIYDVQATKAHVSMLKEIDLLTNNELLQILGILNKIETDIREGRFTIEDKFEDVHSKIEFEVIDAIGESGKKIHTARSRNDQVLVALHLYTKDQIKQIKELSKELFSTLLTLADQHKSDLIPGYTHLQIAMPSSFGLWFSSYAESLIDDLVLFNAVNTIADQNPLGSAAGYGSSFPIDRELTTRLLGFQSLKYNSVAAQMSRGKLERSMAFALASISGTLSKLSADVVLYMSQNFNFVTFPKELTTGSSIMPHKQNPDVFELVRARSNKVQNLPQEITMITNNLTSGYHRDFQILKEGFIHGVETVKQNLRIVNYMIKKIEINSKVLDDQKYDPIYSVEEVNKMVMNGMSFREAYRIMGESILNGDFNPDKRINHTHEGSIGNLCLEEIQKKFDVVYYNSANDQM